MTETGFGALALCSLLASSAASCPASPAPSAGGDWAVSVSVPFEASAGPGGGPISMEAAPGEFEPACFWLRPPRDVERLVLAPTDLRGRGGTISSQHVDLRIVNVWTQAGRGPRKTRPVRVSELLLKDDRYAFADSYDAEQHYHPPAVPDTLFVRTKLRAGESKQFWVTVEVPPGASPGEYRGSLRAESSGEAVFKPLELRVTVLPIRLREPAPDRLIYYRGCLDPGRAEEFVGEERFVEDLTDIRDHGFTGVTLFDSQEPHVRRALELIATQSLFRTVVFVEPNPRFMELAGSYGFRALFYGVDEPNSPDRMKLHLEKASRIRAFGGVTVVAIDKRWAERLAEPGDLNHPLDVANLPLGPDFFRWVEEGGPARERRRLPRVWYYWQVMMEKPGLHRLLSGFFLWRSGVAGIFPYVYQHLKPPSSPFDDFARWWFPDHRVHMVTYPSSQGPIPTLQWEALREGIDDLRYVVTLEHWIRKANGSSDSRVREASAAASALLQGLARGLTLDDPRIEADDVVDPIQGVGPSDYSRWRAQVARCIINLQHTMGEHVR